MLSSLHRSLLLVRFSSIQTVLSAPIVLSHTFCSSALKDDNSFTVSYLVDSCGLSRDSALTISKYINIRNRDKPDRVLAFLRAHSFSDTQIARVVRGHAYVLLSTPERVLIPKFEFFYSKGFSKQDIARILSKQPNILKRSLKHYIVPLFDFYKSLFESDEEVVAAIKCSTRLLRWGFETLIVQRINVLKDYGIPMASVVWLLRWQPESLIGDIDSLKNNLEKLREMGFNTQSKMFVTAYIVMKSMSKDTWDKKVSVYKGWGWSEETVMKAFLKQPLCMAKSKEKIAAVMDYFVDKLGCESSVLADYPAIISYSMEGRIVPRTKVIQILQKKGLVSNNIKWSTPLVVSEKNFVLRYIDPYEKEVPELMKLYGKRLAPSTSERNL